MPVMALARDVLMALVLEAPSIDDSSRSAVLTSLEAGLTPYKLAQAQRRRACTPAQLRDPRLRAQCDPDEVGQTRRPGGRDPGEVGQVPGGGAAS